MGKYYRDYADFLKERFEGKVQKLTVDVGHTCPNRDGTKGRGGCIYCNNASFSPALAAPGSRMSVAAQLQAGKEFFARKYPTMRYLAYFQSYTNTHDDPSRLIARYREALAVSDVVGLIIGTRPDSVSPELLAQLSEINSSGKRVIIEYGAESSHDTTLQAINRCHTWADTVNAVNLTREAGIDVGLHFIMGLPGESRDMMLATVDAINRLRPDTVKFHQLQVIDHTPLARMWREGSIDLHLFEVGEYLDLCKDIVGRLDPSIAIERFTSSAPSDLLLAPHWGLKNYQFTNLLNNLLAVR